MTVSSIFTNPTPQRPARGKEITVSKTFKVSAMGDQLYFEADTLDEAKQKMKELLFGLAPDAMLTWSEVDSLPEGEEYVA